MAGVTLYMKCSKCAHFPAFFVAPGVQLISATVGPWFLYAFAHTERAQ